MSWIKHTGARYHTQDTGYYCGAACAMMILNEIGVPYSDLDQDDLYTSNHDHNVLPGWYTDPYGLRYTLVDRRPAGFTNTFVVYKRATEAEGSRDLVYTLWRYGVSPSVLVYGCAHWIVVPGVQTNVEPAPGASYTVEGFWIHNPVYKDNEPHGATDSCGTGGAEGTSNEFVTYLGWQTTYLTGCPYDAPDPQYISVCDPDERDLELPRRRPIERRFKERRLLTPNEAQEAAEVEIRDYRLHQDRRIKERLANSRPAAPIPVLRLDRLNSYYYLVPWGTDEGVGASAQVDAWTGLLQGVRLHQDPVRKQVLSRKNVLSRIAGKRFEIKEKGRLGRLTLYPETACISPFLVWRPCQESWSPHLPFYQVTVGNHRLYVRLDGEVFTHLTTVGKGM
ncbi:MAG TPA: hypothetical protein VFR31_03060 [Thermoanaerobaculia bacterium]|nr:hypothetical protein [Thermoanaerobaculia bacterium]